MDMESGWFILGDGSCPLRRRLCVCWLSSLWCCETREEISGSTSGCISSHCHVFHRPPRLVMFEPLWFITQAGKGYCPPDPRGSEWGAVWQTEDRCVFLTNVAFGRNPFFFFTFTVNGNPVWNQPSVLMFLRNKNPAALWHAYQGNGSACQQKQIHHMDVLYVELRSYVNNHPLLCPTVVCCQGKTRGLFARRKNYLPQEKRIIVSLPSRILQLHVFLYKGYSWMGFSSGQHTVWLCLLHICLSAF